MSSSVHYKNDSLISKSLGVIFRLNCSDHPLAVFSEDLSLFGLDESESSTFSDSCISHFVIFE